MYKILLALFISSVFSDPASGLTLFSPIISMPQEGTAFNTYLINNGHDIIN